MHACILNEYRKQRICRLTLLLKEYAFIYLPYIEGLKGSWTGEYQTKNIFIIDSSLIKWVKFFGW
jgi:hypothetical protein